MELQPEQFIDFDLNFPGFARFESSALECYLKILEDQIGFAQEQFKIREERKLRLQYKENKLSHEEYGQSLFVVDDIANQHFPRLFRNGAIVSIWSHFEYSTTVLASYARKNENKELLLTDINGKNFIDKIRKYFDKELGIVLPWSKNEYDSLGALLTLRNFLAHKSGTLIDLSEEDQKKYEKLSKIKNVSKVEGNIIVEESYVSESAELVFKAIYDLKKVLANKYGHPVGLW